MKNLLIIFFLPIFITSCLPTGQSSDIKIIYVKTYSKCDACKYFLESSLPGKKGIVFAELDLKKETLMIKYNQTQVSTKKIKEYISGKGFWADELKPDEELERQLPSCCVKPREDK